MTEAQQMLHPTVGLTSPSLGPLRLDSGGLDTPGSGGTGAGKMVSLADLHVNSGGPLAPRDVIGTTQGIDPLDPLPQLLVQDQLFIAAVQTSQLHAAAAAATKLLRAHLPGASHEFKRPVDRRFAASRRAGADGSEANGRSAGQARVLGHSHLLGPTLRSIKQDVLQLEDSIPWTSVRRTWRNKRTSWQRQVKQTELVPELAARLRELRISLLADDATFIGCGQAWRTQLELCVQGRGTAELLVSVWDELKNTIRSWLGMGGGGTAGGSGGLVEAGAARAVQALQAAVRWGGTDVLLQTPLESIVGNDSLGLHAVRQAIELERRIVAQRLSALNQVGDEPAAEPMVSYFTSISAPWGDSDFDSGADSEADGGGSEDMTDIDSDLDA